MKYAVYVVVIEDTNESIEQLSQTASTIDCIEDEIPSEEFAIDILREVVADQK